MTTTDADEDRVRALLATYGLDAERFSKEERRLSKTPDFKVFQTRKLRFFCEVKTVIEPWLDRQLDEVQPGMLAGGGRPDPTFNRLTSDIHEAVQQFDAVNPSLELPNVLAFVNRDDDCGVEDLLSILTGDFVASSGERHPIYRQYSEGRIRDEKRRVDLFIWLETDGTHHFRLWGDSSHRQTICGLLGIDPNTPEEGGAQHL